MTKLVGQQIQRLLTWPAPEVSSNLTQTFTDFQSWKRFRTQLKFVGMHLLLLA